MNPRIRFANAHAPRSASLSGSSGDKARYPIRSPGIPCDFDHELQIAVCRMIEATSGCRAPSNTRCLYGSSLITITVWSCRSSIA